MGKFAVGQAKSFTYVCRLKLLDKTYINILLH